MNAPATGVGARAVFFDRDGTLNLPATPGEYIRRPEDLRLTPGAAVAVRQVNDAGLRAVLLTNQRWLSGPTADPGAYASIESKLSELLAVEGARLDASYTCPHAADSCDCRKPLPGLLLRAADELGLNLLSSYFIGDSVTDAQAGAAAGVSTILISKEQVPGLNHQATHVVDSIEKAVEVIVNAAPKPSAGVHCRVGRD